MRHILILCALFNSIAAFGFNWNKPDYSKPHISITPDLVKDYRLEGGETAQFNGSICLVNNSSFHRNFWNRQKKDKTHCKSLDLEGKFKKHRLKFYFPDTNTDVTDLVSVNKSEKGIDFSFTSNEVNPDLANQLTVIVEEGDRNFELLRRSQAKIELYLEYLNRKKNKYSHKKGRFWKEHYQKKLDRWIAIFERLNAKIQEKLENDPFIFARLDWPVQVENNIAPPVQYSTVVSGFKLFMEIPLGVAIEGETTKIRARVSNLIEQEDDSEYEQFNWGWFKKHRWKYWAEIYWNGEKVGTSEKSVLGPGGLVDLEYQTLPLGPAEDNQFELKFFKGKELPSHLSRFKQVAVQNWGGISYQLDVQTDTTAPKWTQESLISETQYFQQYPMFKIQAEDEFGRLRKSSLKVSADVNPIAGVETTLDFFPSLEISEKDQVFAPTFHGIEDGASVYQVSGNLNPLEEGFYTLTAEIEDFSGANAQPQPLTRLFRIDRTKPVLTVAQADNQLTNNPSFDLPISVVDDSPTTTKIIHNGELIAEYSDKEIVHTLTLVEEINTIEVQVVDAAGNEAESFKLNNIDLDTIAPELAESNPAQGDILRRLVFPVNGVSNEPLSKVIVDDEHEAQIVGSGDRFTLEVERTVQGPNQIKFAMTDLAGNSAEYTVDFEIILKLIRTELIAVTQDEETGRLNIIGAPGAVVRDIKIDLSGGFFNTTQAQVEHDGSFEAQLDYFTSASIEAYYAPLDKYESESISSNVNPALSGVVKDALSDEPLSGVTVTIQENGKSAVTDGMGIFSIGSPGSGSATLVIDGTTMSPLEAELNENGVPLRKYATQVVRVVLSNTKANILEKPVYFTPLLMDGSQTEVLADQETVVTSPHAPGVELVIPPNVANFPGLGVDPETGEEIKQHINVVKLDRDKTTYNPPKTINPDFIYSFEPSGLTFKERVKLALPNENEFVVGQKLVIMSKNSSTGNWELDGTATVVSPDRIETDENAGITHFSDIYAVPYSPDIASFDPQKDKPQLTTAGNSASTSINLPSFKKFGQNITPSLNYKSSWANPRALVSQIFNLERQHYEVKIDEKETANSFTQILTKGTYKYWTEPDYIKSKFFVDNKESDEITFNIKDAPENAVVSYAMNLDDVDSGIYRARSEYKIRFKHFEQIYAKIYSRNTITKSKDHIDTIDDGPKELDDIENDGIIIPPALDDIIYQQNLVNSEIGRGWKLGFTQRIYQPKDDRIMVEEANGAITPYVIDNTVENLRYDENGIIALDSSKFPEISYSTEDGKIVTTDALEEDASANEVQTPNYEIGIGLNFAWRYYRRREKYDCHDGCNKKYKHYYRCIKQKAHYDLPRRIFSLHSDQTGRFVYLDHRGAVFAHGNEDSHLAGKLITPGKYVKYQLSQPSPTNHCKFYTQNQKGCENYNPDYSFTNVTSWTSSSSRPPSPAYCAAKPDQNSYGIIPNRSYNNTTVARDAYFKDPRAIVPSKHEGGVVYVADTFNNLVRKVNTITNTITTYGGNRNSDDNKAVYHEDGRTATATPIYRPNGIVEDSQGNIYVSSERGYVRKITPDGKIYTVAGKERGSTVAINNTLDKVKLDRPWGLALDESRGFLYVADTNNNRVVLLELDNNKTVQIAGKGQATCTPTQAEGRPALDTDLCAITNIGLDSEGNLLVVDHKMKMIRRVILQQPSAGKFRFKSLADDGSKIIRYGDGSLERLYRNGSSAAFTAEGRQIRSIDKNSKETAFVYSGNQLTRVDFPDQTSMTLNYSNGLLTSIVDPANRATYFDYNGNKLERVTYPDSTSKTFVYRESDGALAQEIDQRGYTTHYEYNKWDFLEKVIRPDGHDVVLSYGISDTVGNDYVDGNTPEVKSQTNEEGENEFKDTFIGTNEVETQIYKNMSGYAEEIVQKLEDGDKVTRIERDSKGRPIKITRPDLSYTEFLYSDSENSSLPLCKNVSGDLNNIACNNSEIADLIEKYDSKSGQVEYYEYNKFGDVLFKSISEGGEVISFAKYKYDVEGNVIEQEDANGNKVFKSYYPNTGLLKTTTVVVNGSSLVTTLEYDESGNLIKRTMPDGEITTYVRDLAGNIVSKTNAKGISTDFTYDIQNRLTGVITGIFGGNAGTVTTYSYNETGALAQIIDPIGNKTSFEYNEVGQLSKKITPLGQIFEMDYDGSGNLVWEKDPNGNVKTYSYNDKDELVKKILPDNLYEMSYDDSGNLVEISDDDTSLAFDYEKIGENFVVTNTTSSYSGIGDLSLDYGYNAKGLRSSMTTPYGQFSYSYDDGGRLVSLVNHRSEAFSMAYDSADRLVETLRPGSVSKMYYDGNSFLTGILHESHGGANIALASYTRDGIGNRKTLETKFDRLTYSYDSESQLTAVERGISSLGDSLALEESFAYDSLGNRLSDKNGGYQYGAKSQRLTEDFLWIYSYDNNGNLIQKTSKQDLGTFVKYTFNSENQLVKIEEYEENSKKKSFVHSYDALGRRYQKEVINHQDSTKSYSRKYLYDGQEILAELDENNDTLAVYTHSTMRTDDVLGVDILSEKLASTPGSYFYLKDGLGSVTDIADASGNLIQHYSYSSFGELLKIVDASGTDVTASAPVKTSYGFTNREHDESGLMYYRARYYEPKIGRFISEDPDAGKMTQPRSFASKFGYVLNNPLNFTDPLGLFPVSIKIGGDLGKAFRGIGDTFKNVGREIGNFYENNRSEIIATAVVVGAVASGGALGVAAGAILTSAAIGGAVGAGVAVATGQDPWKGALAGAAGGALVATGVGFAVAATSGATAIAAGAGMGIVTGVAAAHVGAQITRGEWATGQEMFIGGLAGGIGGMVAGALAGGGAGARFGGAVNDFNRSATTSGASSSGSGGSSGGTDFVPSI